MQFNFINIYTSLKGARTCLATDAAKHHSSFGKQYYECTVKMLNLLLADEMGAAFMSMML